MDMRATMGITFGAGVLVGFVIGQLVAAIKERKEEEKEEHICNEVSKTKSEKIPEGNFEEEIQDILKEYGFKDQKWEDEEDEELEGQLSIADQDTSDHIGLQHAYEISADDWNEDMGANWSYRTYFWNKTRLMWYTAEGDEADYTDIHLELGDDLCKRICNHTRLYRELIFRRDDLMMDIRVFVTDDEGMPEAIQRYS